MLKGLVSKGWLIGWVLLQQAGLAQVNSWTNPASAHWEDPYWSLGILPGAGQSVVISNDTWKAIGIFPTTPVNYPETMLVSDLTLGATPGSLNMLLLNYSGTNSPLRISNQLELDANGLLRSDGSVVSWGDAPPDPGLSNVVAIAAGTWHSLALLEPVTLPRPLLSGPQALKNHTFQFALQGQLGYRYVVETSTNLTDWTFFRNVAGQATPVSLVCEPAAGSAGQFYRARISP